MQRTDSLPKGFKKNVNRATTQVMMKTGHVEKTNDRDYEVEGWFGLFAPAKTPRETVSRLVNTFAAAMQVPAVRVKLATLGLYPIQICGSDFGTLIRRQYEEYGRVIREAQITAQ